MFQSVQAEYKTSHIENEQALAAYHEKFLSNAPLSSQISGGLGAKLSANRTVDLY